ncbi:MAG: hypothetical protein ACOWWO_01780 [Peptococcaceae bacterium]
MAKPDNVEKSYKCSQCGMMFTDRDASRECPFCHHYCKQGECEVVNTSNEGF